MKKLWRAAMEAKACGADEKDIFFDVTDTSSPYGEATVKNAYSPFGPEENRIAVNPYYSYGEIFDPLLHPGKVPELTRYLCDMILHSLCETDSRAGMDLEEFYIHFLEKDIRMGAFGPEACIEDFTDQEIRRLAYYYLRFCRTGDGESCYCSMLRFLYEGAWVSAREDGSLVVFVNCAQTPLEERKVMTLRNLFLEIGRSCRIFWEYPPGIIGCGQTVLGNFILY